MIENLDVKMQKRYDPKSQFCRKTIWWNCYWFLLWCEHVEIYDYWYKYFEI